MPDNPQDRPDIDCKTKQNVPQSITLAYIFLVVMVLVFIPLLFISGVLGVIAGVWRNDINVVLFKMAKKTSLAFRMQVEKIHAEQLEYEDAELRKAFDQIDNDRSGTIEPKELGPLVMFLAPEFIKLDSTLEEIVNGLIEKHPGDIGYHQMRSLVTLIAEVRKRFMATIDAMVVRILIIS